MEINRREVLQLAATPLLLPLTQLAAEPEPVQKLPIREGNWKPPKGRWKIRSIGHLSKSGIRWPYLGLSLETGRGIPHNSIQSCPETCYSLDLGTKEAVSIDLYPNNCTLSGDGHEFKLHVIYRCNAWEHVFYLSESDYYLALSTIYKQASVNVRAGREFLIDGDYANKHILWKGANCEGFKRGHQPIT